MTYLKESNGKRFAILDGGMNQHAAATGMGTVIRRAYPMVRATRLKAPAGEEGGAATGGVPQARRMTAHQVARERIRQEVAATRERNHRITHDLTTESLLNDLGPALWISFNAGYKHPGATPGTRTGVSTIQKTHIYDPKADGAAKWSADIDKTHNLKMDTFMKHADKCLQLGEKPFKSGGMKLAAGSS